MATVFRATIAFRFGLRINLKTYRATMDTIYLGIGAALYLVFAVWCILAPQK
jgi:hypothetical protein